MLLFVDQVKHIRVLRSTVDATGATSRERLGLITKATLEPTPELAATLSPEEQDELKAAIDVFQLSRKVQRKAQAMNFPETMRIVAEYMVNDATDTERKLIVSSLMEGVRMVRKYARQEASQTS